MQAGIKLMSVTEHSIPSILVVEDDDASREMLSRRLQRRGYSVETVAGGCQAIDLINNNQYDAVLLDLMMPEVSGQDVLRTIREKNSRSMLPVIVVSARAEREVIIEALHQGANDYITKPIDFAVLQARLEAQIELRNNAENNGQTVQQLNELVRQRTNELGRMDESLKLAIASRKSAEEALDRTEQHYKVLLNASPSVIYATTLRDEVHDCSFVSSALERITGYPPAEMLNNSGFWYQNVHPDDRVRVLQELPDDWNNAEGSVEYRFRTRDGRYRYIQDSFRTYHDEAGGQEEIVGAWTDITERVEADKEIQRTNEQLRLLLDSSSEGIFGLDGENRCTFINRNGARSLGYRTEELIGTDMYETVHAKKEDGTPLAREQCPMIKVNTDGQGRREYDQLFWRKDGTSIPVEYSAFPVMEQGEITGVVVCFSDITERKLAEARLNYVVNYDSLTDLPNRNLFHDRLSIALNRVKQGDHKLAVLFIDLDGFKDINDSLGHNMGDHVLRNLAGRINQDLDDNQFCARLGGDEFAMLADNISHPDAAADLAQNLFKSLTKPFRINDKNLYVRASIGISIYPDDGMDAQTLLKNADTAMFRTKTKGTNMYQFYTADMNADSTLRLELDADLRQAIDRQEFELFYQPQADISTGIISGFEALMRWNHPERGMVSPVEFITLLEETGLIVEVGEWAIRTACNQLRQWHQKFGAHLKMSVNLSGRQFTATDLFNPVIRILAETDIPPQNLELEITESILMENLHAVTEILNALSVKGVQFSIDDFGTGYSSLAYLKRLPVHKLKIDQTFVRDMHIEDADRSLCSAIIAMGHSLNLKVIAEGVESEEHVDILDSMTCDEIQGYFLAKPLPASEMESLLEAGITIKSKRKT